MSGYPEKNSEWGEGVEYVIEVLNEHTPQTYSGLEVLVSLQHCEHGFKYPLGYEKSGYAIMEAENRGLIRKVIQEDGSPDRYELAEK